MFVPEKKPNQGRDIQDGAVQSYMFTHLYLTEELVRKSVSSSIVNSRGDEKIGQSDNQNPASLVILLSCLLKLDFPSLPIFF